MSDAALPPNGLEVPDLQWFRASDEPLRQLIDWEYSQQTGERRFSGATIEDPLYGRFHFDYAVPGDAALLDLVVSEPFNRLALIEQLILPEQFATKPEAARYTTYEHSLGCALLVRRLGGSAEQQLRAAIHDISKKAFGHLDDWRKQGVGGPEDFHESTMHEHLAYWGLDRMFEMRGFSVDALVQKQPPDFVENSAPDLCVDRVDYALREFARWTCPDEVPRLIEELLVQDGMIVLKSQASARIFADNYHRLYWEHWSETEHAVREKLLLVAIDEGVKTGAITEADMDTVDPLVLVKLEMFGNEVVQELLRMLQQPRLALQVMKGFDSAIPKDYLASQTDRVYIPLQDFKRRWVDPSFINETGARIRLSQVDPEFREYLETSAQVTTAEQLEAFGQLHGIDEPWMQYVEVATDAEGKNILRSSGQFF